MSDKNSEITKVEAEEYDAEYHEGSVCYDDGSELLHLDKLVQGTPFFDGYRDAYREVNESRFWNDEGLEVAFEAHLDHVATLVPCSICTTEITRSRSYLVSKPLCGACYTVHSPRVGDSRK